MTKRRRGRGSSKAGRPRKTGVTRYPSGRIVQKSEPNERVIAERTLLMGDTKGDLGIASDPIALAFAKGWLTEAEVKAGDAYARYWRASHPQHVQRAPHESPNGERDGRNWLEMPSAEICALFDNMMETTARRQASEGQQAKARERYNRLSRALTAAEQLQVFQCFCLRAWPQWMIQLIAGKPPEGVLAAHNMRLHRALGILDRLLTRSRTTHIVEMKSLAICA